METANQLLSQIHDIKSHQKQARPTQAQQRHQTRTPQPQDSHRQAQVEPPQVDFDRMSLNDGGRNGVVVEAGRRMSFDQGTGVMPPYADPRDFRSSPVMAQQPLPPTLKPRIYPEQQQPYVPAPSRTSYDMSVDVVGGPPQVCNVLGAAFVDTGVYLSPFI